MRTTSRIPRRPSLIVRTLITATPSKRQKISNNLPALVYPIDIIVIAGYTNDMNIFIIRAENPLDMEGSADVAAVFLDENLAQETAAALNAQAETENRKVYKDRWRSMAIEYRVEAHPVRTDVAQVLAYHKNDE